jgi:3-keto-L-gulonate-6-phosphate decarboxylase
MQKILCRELFTGKEIIKDAFVVFDSNIVDLGEVEVRAMIVRQ